MQENKMGVMPIPKLLLNMSLPMICSMLVQALYNVVDSIFVGMIDQQSLTAVGLAFPAQHLVIALASGTAVGVNALLSRALGAKQQQDVNKTAENGVFLALVGYVIFLIFGIFGSRAAIAAQTDVEYIIQQGTMYLRTVSVLSFGVFGQVIFERLLQSTGKTFYSMITQGTGAIINIILDPIFIFAFDMGIFGAAMATVIGQCVACALAIWFNYKKNPEVQMDFKRFRPEWRYVRGILSIGIPSTIMMAIGSVMTFCMNKILIAYTAGKEVAATVFGVYFKLNSIFFMPIFGLNNGAVPIIAYNYGARRKDRMLHTVRLSIFCNLGFMLFGTALFLAIPHLLLGMFNADGAMLAIGVPALRLISTSFLPAALCIGIGSIFQALGKGTYSMIVSIIRQLLVLIPSAFVLARIGMAVGNDNLVWLSYPIAEVFSVIVSLLLFFRIKKNIIDPLDMPNE